MRLRWCWLTIVGVASLLAACDLGPPDPATEMYVRVPSSSAPEFTSTLATMLKDTGLRASIGQSTAPAPGTTYVLDAKNLSVRIRAQNVVLSPAEAMACGYPAEVSREQTQYLVSVQRRSPLATDRARLLFTELKNKLGQRGYIIAGRQMPCARLTAS